MKVLMINGSRRERGCSASHTEDNDEKDEKTGRYLRRERRSSGD